MQTDCGLGQPQFYRGLGEAEVLCGGREGPQPYEVWKSLHFHQNIFVILGEITRFELRMLSPISGRD